MPKQKSSKKQAPPKRPSSVLSKTGPSPFAARQMVPTAVSYQTPSPRFRAKQPTLGGCACYEGVDFVGSLASLSSSSQSGAYTAIHPTNATLFPRLSAIADVFLRYKFKKLILHFLGRSASTVAGNGGFSSLVLDDDTGSTIINTEALIKNTEGCLVVKGWEAGSHKVDLNAQGLKWYTTDTGSTSFTYVGSVVRTIPQTTANGDLTWDFYVEYEIEFDEALAGGSVNLLRSPRDKTEGKETKEVDDLLRQLNKLQRRIDCLQGASVQ